jgi:hypothetical protein
MERLAALLFSTFVVALAAAGTTSAADGSYGPWEATSQGSITAPAGYVCRFTVTAEPVSQDLRIRYHYDAAGNIDRYQVTGQLIGRITNARTPAPAWCETSRAPGRSRSTRTARTTQLSAATSSSSSLPATLRRTYSCCSRARRSSTARRAARRASPRTAAKSRTSATRRRDGTPGAVRSAAPAGRSWRGPRMKESSSTVRPRTAS